ncbi:MAG TPA: SEL1-like repeat protein [Candidatus Blautia excrementipullorum]|nr:SEL1-like repeat protein [Candidatus Blautia excrementipullorum]
MPKLIFTSRYMRDAPPQYYENYVRYISTREGVETIEGARADLPASQNQRNMITQLIRDIPDAKNMLEYADFLGKPTMENASEFITCALEQNLNLIGKRKNYVDYIAQRPRVERIGKHGLFTDAGTPIVLSQVQKDVAAHKGPVWTHVISLRREDAVRLGYDSAAQWMALLRSKRAMLCKYMKIDSANLRWYAAFHNEGHHPHVHLMVYSAKDNDGYLTEKSIEAMRSELAHDIFRQDYANIYEGQNEARADLKSGMGEILREQLEALHHGMLASTEIEKMMVRLSKRLQNTSGKKVYGYLKRDVKDLIDQIVNELEKDPRVSELYQTWGSWQNELLSVYQSKRFPLPPLSEQKQFKSIKNMVIQEALAIADGRMTFEEEVQPKGSETEGTDPEEETFIQPEDVIEDTELEAAETTNPGRCAKFYAEWNQRYKLARAYLYGNEKIEQNFAQALTLFLQEAEAGNALAMYDLGRMYADGLGCDEDPEAAHIWYAKALAAFQSAEAQAEEKKRPYLWYRIGKMYAAVLDIEEAADSELTEEARKEQRYQKAASWLERAADTGHKYAQYSLAGLYYRGQGVEQNYEKAFCLYASSAEQGNPYASYEQAKMLRDGIGVRKNSSLASEYFADAFAGFRSLEEKSHDDKLQYRLGWMLYTGTGTEKNCQLAEEYWKQAAKLGNEHAQYALAKFWLDTGTGDPTQAVRWLEAAAEKGNQSAQYRLGKEYLLGRNVKQDAGKAAAYFKLAAGQGSEYAAYQLGKLYLSEEYGFKDVDQGIHWMETTAEKGNQYAQYILGKLYLYGGDIPQDKEKAVHYLNASAEQGNIYAQFLLEHMDSSYEPSAVLAATRLLRHLENLFQEDYRKNTDTDKFHRMDRKRRRRLAEKKHAQGHKRDDHESAQKIY